MKRSRTLTLTLTLTLAALLVAAAPALADHGPHGRDGRHASPGAEGFEPGEGPLLDHLTERLELSESQREELGELAAGRREAALEQARALVEAREALARQIHADVLDEGAIRSAAAEIGRLEADRAVARAERLRELRRILSADQVQELEEMLSGGGRGRLRGHRGPGRHGHAPHAG